MDGVSPTGDQAPLYFRQFLAGRDFARDDAVAVQMVNFVYAVGDRRSGEALLVDPAYDIASLLDLLEADGMRCSGVLATHYHPDHVGGDLMGTPVEGIAKLLQSVSVPVHVQREELPWVIRVAGVGPGDLVGHASGDIVQAGAIPVELVHTPGHTPGSQCFAVDGRLIAGDTLFLQGCGRTDLPGGDPEQLYQSLTTRLARFGDETVLYPGHRYTPESSGTLGATRERNNVFKPATVEQWMAMFSS